MPICQIDFVGRHRVGEFIVRVGGSEICLTGVATDSVLLFIRQFRPL